MSDDDSIFWTFMKELIGHAAWFVNWCKPSGVAKLDETMTGSTSALVSW